MKKNKLDIKYEDKYILIIYKKKGMLTVATKKEKINTLYHEVLEYLNKKNQKVFIVHRLDKDTSGLIVFAKTMKVKELLQNHWEEVTRKYYAVVYGKLNKKTDQIKTYLKEDKNYLTHITNDSKNGKLAITNYSVLEYKNNKSLLDINILTGRKNQIRVHLAYLKHPLLGDKKYGIKDQYKFLYLEAYYLCFKHPITKDIIEISLELNKEFKVLFD